MSRLDWQRDGRDWPHREASRFVDAAALRWHVQRMGAGPVAFLLHGTGASTHSWRALMPLLARRFTVVAADLPGHGFTSMPATPSQFTLAGMAGAVRALVAALDLDVALAVGHSAGAAVAARIDLDRGWGPQALVGINPALLPLDGFAGLLFPPVARAMAATPLAARVFAWRAGDRSAVERLIGGTGSTLDADGVALYGRLVRNPGHAAAALAMMANWDLRPLAADLPRLGARLQLIAGSNDRAVPPEQARRVAAAVPGARLEVLAGAGHLAHEERPDECARLIDVAMDAATGAPAGRAGSGPDDRARTAAQRIPS